MYFGFPAGFFPKIVIEVTEVVSGVIQVMVDVKHCAKCHEHKPAHDYYQDKRASDGLQAIPSPLYTFLRRKGTLQWSNLLYPGIVQIPHVYGSVHLNPLHQHLRLNLFD